MNQFIKKIPHRVLIFLMVLGPGTITAIADNDAGGVATYSLLASKFGYSMFFLLLLITVLLAITQEIGARIAIVTGKGLGDLIREYYGIRVAFFIFILLFIANMGSIVANFAGLMAGFSLFNLPKIPFLVIFLFFIIFSIYKGSYQTNQRIFLGVAFLYIAYIFSAFLARPAWGEALKSLVIPTNIQLSSDYLFGAIALLGTTITPWGQFFISSFILDKKLTIDKLKYEKMEVYLGAFLTDFFSFFMMVAVVATLFANNLVINDAAEAALAIKPLAGDFAAGLFALGLLSASYMGAVIISLTTAYAFSEFFGFEGGLDSEVEQSRTFYFLFLVQVIIASFIVLFPNVSLFKIVLYTQSLNGILLPLIIFFLLRFSNNKELMGKHINGQFYNYFATISSVIIVLASILVAISLISGRI